MGIEYFLFTIYLVLSFWLIPKTNFITHAGLTNLQTRLLLAFKMITGVACAYYFEHLSTNSDYLAYNNEGAIQYQLLLSNPVLFFTDFTNDIHTYGWGGLFEPGGSFWAYIRFNLLYKFIAMLNLVTHGNFYFNSIIFSSIVFFAHIAFYRIYSKMYKGQKWGILFVCFCLPSLLLYTSCIHKDGFVFLCLGLISFIIHRALSANTSLQVKHIFYGLMAMVAVFLFRNYVIVAIVPAIITAFCCKLIPFKKRFVILTTYAFFFGLFFLSGLSHSSLNLPAAVVKRKADFAALAKGNTNIPMNELYPTIRSFVINLPQAINHSLFRPYLWEFSQPSVILTALELFVYQMTIIILIFYRKKQAFTVHPFNIFAGAFVLNMMLIIGYTIPNVGAIVRYRSIFWIFIICPVMCNIDWKRLFPNRKNNTGAAE